MPISSKIVSDPRRMRMTSREVHALARKLLRHFRKNDALNALVSACASAGITTLFALYNGYFGIFLPSGWHGSICAFYLLLVAIRCLILRTEWETRSQTKKEREFSRYKTYFYTCWLLILLDLALIAPISLMALMQKPVDIGLIPAIAMAVYTTYKVTMASIHVRRQARRQGGDILITALRSIHFIDALFSILILQNTLIMVNNGASVPERILALAAISSAIIYMAIVLVTCRMWMQRFRKT